MPAAPYSLRQAQRLAGLTPRFIASLVDAGVLVPRADQRFTHQDVVVLRTAKALRDAGVSPAKVMQALRRVKASMAEAPGALSAVRLRASAGRVVARMAGAEHDAHTGQALLPFDDEAVADATSAVTPAPAQDWLARAIQLESSDSAAAEHAYRRALAVDPCCAAAYVNLGALLCEAARCEDAVLLYDEALQHCADAPLVHFNRATALEDLNRPHQAVAAYERALELDPDLADAHYNLAALLERLGDRHGSLRHLSAYRRHRPDSLP